MLDSSFLAPYRQKGDPFPNLLARSTYLGKYCRDGESYTDHIARIVLGNVALDPNVTKDEAEFLFDTFYWMKGQPPGRGHWTGGVKGIPVDARYNCARGTTRFFADGVIKTLAEMVDRTVQVRCIDGFIRPAQIKSFGVQHLFRVTFKPKTGSRTNFRMQFDVTKDHGWITSNRGRVTDLRVGDCVTVTPDAVVQNANYEAGFVHGLVYGDGCATTGRPGHYQIRLCSQKNQHLSRLIDSPSYRSHSFPSSYNGDPHVRLATNVSLDCLPDEEFTLDYQAGFLDGLLAVDGFDLKNRRGIELTDMRAITWIEERAPLLGWVVTGSSSPKTEATNFGPRSARPNRLSLAREAVDFVVESFEDLGIEEEVFCAVEPETHTFTLAGGMPTSNCHYGTLRTPEDWGWVANMLMCGGGVGVGLHSIEELPTSEPGNGRLYVLCSHSHPNRGEVMPEEYVNDPSAPQLLVGDTRQGWVDALVTVMKFALAGKSVAVNLSAIRKRGAPIKTFGGVACGPGPLATLLRQVWSIVRRAAGRKLNSVECLDITNHIGCCIKSGNVRRSALIVLGKAHDQAFRDAKKDRQAVESFRHSSNNSICWETEEQLDTFDWRALVEDQSEFGEPGGLNLWLIRQLDPGVEGVNPCGEIPLWDREACCLSEVYPALFAPNDNVARIFAAVTRYTLRQRLESMSDPRAEAVRAKNMRIGVGLGGICDFDWTAQQLREFRHMVQFSASYYADKLGVNCPIAETTVKPSGTISLLNGSSPGVHAPWADYFIKRARIGVDEPIAAALIEAGVPHEPCIYDSSGRTLAFSFPMAARKKGLNVQSQTVREQIERQVTVQRHWANNAVSSTVSFGDDEKDELAALLKQYVKFDIKSVSCLPKSHGYSQPPYEEISAEDYADLYTKIDHSHPLTTGGELEIEECARGACPVK